MAWNTIAAGLIADADKLNENFNLVAGGSRAPRTSAGASFVTTDGAYDIGSENARWDQVYVNTVDYDGTITTTDNSIYEKISKVTLSGTASTVEISGLEGDSFSQIIITSYIVVNTVSNILMVINGDSSGSYGYQLVAGTASTVFASRLTSQTSILYGIATNSPATTTAYEKTITDMTLYSKTGNERTGVLTFLKSTSGSYSRGNWALSYIWSNSTDSITSIKFYTSDGSMMTGTTFTLWGRQ